MSRVCKIKIVDFSINGRTLTDYMEINISPNSINSLVGPNGCGKSLLLDTITGVHNSENVRVKIGGDDISFYNPYNSWSQGIRRLYQSPRLVEKVRVENIFEHYKIGLASSNTGGKSALEDARSTLLHKAGIQISEEVGEHSFGQRRVIELLVTLSSGTLFLLDEPFAGLNSTICQAVCSLINTMTQQEQTVYFLTVDHLSDERRRFYDAINEWNLPELSLRSNVQPDDIISIEPIIDDKSLWMVESLSINDRVVVENLDIHLDPPGIIAIHGNNGTGKSTLLRALADLPPLWDGVEKKIRGGTDASKTLHSPQPPKLVDSLSVLENLHLMAGRGHSLTQELIEQVQAILRHIGWEDEFIKSRSATLSGGEASLISLAGAVLSPASTLFLDEPFASLSPETKAIGRDLLRCAMASGKGIICIIHDEKTLSSINEKSLLPLYNSRATQGEVYSSVQV